MIDRVEAHVIMETGNQKLQRRPNIDVCDLSFFCKHCHKEQFCFGFLREMRNIQPDSIGADSCKQRQYCKVVSLEERLAERMQFVHNTNNIKRAFFVHRFFLVA